MYYTKNAKDPHPELMEKTLGCYSKQTATIQKEIFQSIIKDSINDEEKADKVFMEVQENLNSMVEEYNSIYDDTDAEPITLTKENIQNLLKESSIPEEITAKIEQAFEENFSENLPLAENLIDAKTLKANEQRKKEEHLIKQVETLQTRLEEVKQESAAAIDKLISEDGKDAPNVSDESFESNLGDDESTVNYDIVIQIKPEKIPQIKSQIINGQRCIVIPVDEHEHTRVNDLTDLI